MIVYPVKALIIHKDYNEEKDHESLNTIQSFLENIYFIDDIVSIKLISKNNPIIGRLCDIGDNKITIDCSKDFLTNTIDIDKIDILSIEMYRCPENVLVRKHIKGV